MSRLSHRKCVWPNGSVLLLLALLAGCDAPDRGTVSGSVKFRDRPIPFGTIAFIGQDGAVSSGMIHDGTYTVANVPVGPAKITVFAYPPPPPAVFPSKQQSASQPIAPAPFVRIPERYSDSQHSGLVYTVTPSEQTHDIVLEF